MSEQGRIHVDASLALRALDRAVKDLPEFFREEAGIIFTRLSGRSIGTYMRNAAGEADRRSSTDRGPLRIVSSRLAKSLTGAEHAGSREGIRRVKATLRGGKFEFGSEVEYSRIHELGGEAGPKARRVTIPARPYLTPALEDETGWILRRLDRDFQTYMTARFGGVA